MSQGCITLPLRRCRLELLAERVSGPHRGFVIDEDEFCALVTPLLD